MSAFMYRLSSARNSELESDIPSFEEIRRIGQADPSQAAGFVSAMTLDQLRQAADAIRFVASSSAVSSTVAMEVVSDGPVAPIIDGVAQYQGPPDVNPDWRVAVQVQVGDSSTAFFGALAYLETREATGAYIR